MGGVAVTDRVSMVTGPGWVVVREATYGSAGVASGAVSNGPVPPLVTVIWMGTEMNGWKPSFAE